MFKCNSCGYQSNRKFNMQKHILNVHNSNGNYEELVITPIQTIFTQITTRNIQTDSKSTQTTQEDFLLLADNNNENICEKCLKTFKTAHGFKKHKLICKGVSNILECHFCHRVFSCQQAKSKHLKICKVKKIQEQNDVEKDS